MRYHTDAAQIKSVCVPACSNSWVLMVVTVRVPNTGVTEQLKLIVRQLKPGATNFGRKLSSTSTMI